MAYSFQTLRLDAAEHIVAITLSRPCVGNAVNELAAREIRDACDIVRQDDGIRAVILAGDGPDFCVGTDPAELPASPDAIARLKASGAIAAIEKPTIALVQGSALDQGLELALACDIRVAAADARFGMAQLRSGAVPWDGGTQRLPRLIGVSRAMEMLLTSRALNAEEALRVGLVNYAAESAAAASERAQALAAAIAERGPIAARYLKEAMAKGADMTLAQGLGLEADLSVILQSTADRAEGIASFLQRRPPQYTGE